MTVAVMPGEDRIDRGRELETWKPPQKETDEEAEVKPQEVTCHAAREHTHTHQKLKMRTSEPPILRLPDIMWTFILLAVASCIWIGAVLLQGDSAAEERPIASRQLQYLCQAKFQNGRLMRWALTLQPYRFLLRAIRGRDNVGADCLSRNPLDDDPVE